MLSEKLLNILLTDSQREYPVLTSSEAIAIRAAAYKLEADSLKESDKPDKEMDES